MPHAKVAPRRRSATATAAAPSSPPTAKRATPVKAAKQAKATAAQTAAASPWPPVSHRERQREAKRNAVLQAAAQLFNERGFHATSLDDIAARLNVTKPTLYYYVKNKDEILLQCVSKGLTMMLEGIDASRAAGGKAIDQLMTCMQVYARIVTMDFGMCLIRVGDEQLPPKAARSCAASSPPSTRSSAASWPRAWPKDRCSPAIRR